MDHLNKNATINRKKECHTRSRIGTDKVIRTQRNVKCMNGNNRMKEEPRMFAHLLCEDSNLIAECAVENVPTCIF